jgi:hypothetical protein
MNTMFDQKSAQYGQPNDGAISTARQWRDFTIVGRDAKGNVGIVSTLNQHETEALVREAAPGLLEPAG